MNINGILTRFAQEQLVLGYDDKERERINSSLAQLEKVIGNKFIGQVKQIIRFGSYTRNTILPRKYDPNSDVDLMIVFNTSTLKYSPGTYRKQLHDVILASYPNSLSAKDFPVVKLELNHIMFDIVPAYKDDSHWGTGSYYIPAANDSWRSTTPNDINDELARKNQSYGHTVVRNVIRLCKHWNASAGYPLESYTMEKQMINSVFWHGDDLYNKFTSVLNNIAGTRPGVKQALDYIRQYKGDYWTPANEAKQLEWLQKLLPGLQ